MGKRDEARAYGIGGVGKDRDEVGERVVVSEIPFADATEALRATEVDRDPPASSPSAILAGCAGHLIPP